MPTLAFSSGARSWSLALAAVLFVLLSCVAPPAACAESRRVVLVLDEAEGSGQAIDTHLFGALRGQLRELDVEVLVVRSVQEPLASATRRARQIAKAQRALGVIWLELPRSGPSVYLYDSSGHLYARDVEPDGSAVSQSEAIAIILRSAIAAMLEGELVSMTEVPLPPPSGGPVPVPALLPPAPRSPSGAATGDRAYVRAGLSYVGTLFARRTTWQHGAALVITVAGPDSPLFFGLDYTQFAAVELESNGVRTRVERHPIEGFGGLQRQVGPVFFNVQGALSADYMVRTTEHVGVGFLATPASRRWLWAVSTRLGVTVPVWRRLYGVLNLGADFVLNPFHQVVPQTSASADVVGSPLVARPRLELGALISVW